MLKNKNDASYWICGECIGTEQKTVSGEAPKYPLAHVSMQIRTKPRMPSLMALTFSPLTIVLIQQL